MWLLRPLLRKVNSTSMSITLLQAHNGKFYKIKSTISFILVDPEATLQCNPMVTLIFKVMCTQYTHLPKLIKHMCPKCMCVRRHQRERLTNPERHKKKKYNETRRVNRS